MVDGALLPLLHFFFSVYAPSMQMQRLYWNHKQRQDKSNSNLITKKTAMANNWPRIEVALMVDGAPLPLLHSFFSASGSSMQMHTLCIGTMEANSKI